ncbi:MAG: HNH endonuclease [Phycisphaeraceae bacterium]|nr:HNH endonuclease [Phycisphaeraceae bacterium]
MRRRTRKAPDLRRSAAARGYDGDWSRLAKLHRAREPLCRHCARAGRAVPAALVDHIRPIRGPHDPGRLDPENLQSLCRACHARKTDAETL